MEVGVVESGVSQISSALRPCLLPPVPCTLYPAHTSYTGDRSDDELHNCNTIFQT
jgi:hypothetical protein